MRTDRFLRSTLLLLFAAGLGACAGKAPVAVGIASLPSVIEVKEWPYWIDIPIEETSVDRIWRTTIDIVGERAAIAVMDRESGYMRTEWKSTDIRYGDALSEERYTIRLRPQEGKIRLGLEVRLRNSNSYVSRIINSIQSPWTAVYRELQQRLVKM